MAAGNKYYISGCDRFGISKGLAHSKFLQFVSAVDNLGPQFISCPRGDEAQRTVSKFENLRNRLFPGVIGCVDGMHIQIPAQQ